MRWSISINRVPAAAAAAAAAAGDRRQSTWSTRDVGESTSSPDIYDDRVDWLRKVGDVAVLVVSAMTMRI